MPMHSCPYCQCGSCQQHKEEQTIWQRERDSAISYPGYQPAAQNISRVTRQGNQQTHYVDLGERNKRSPEVLDRKPQNAIFPQPQAHSQNLVQQLGRRFQPNQNTGKSPLRQTANPAPKPSNAPCPTTGKPPTLTPEQRKQIIDICQRNPQDEEIGGFIELMPDGSVRITQEPNLAPPSDRHDSFGFVIDGKPVVGVWHRHVKRLGHTPNLSGPDIDAARRTGLSSYVVWDVQEKSKKPADSEYQWDEYHPNGTPNQIPTRSYDISFSCPPAEQLIKDMERAADYVEKDNKCYQKAVVDANQKIAAKQKEAITIATQTLTTASDIKTKAEAIAARLNFATSQPKLLPQGVNQDVRMGKQPREIAPLHAQQRNHPAIGNTNRGLYLPESRRVAAVGRSDQRDFIESWINRESH